MIFSRTTLRPRVAIVLGSGLGDFAEALSDVVKFEASEVSGYPRSSVAGHQGKIIIGRLQHKERVSKPLLIFQGRVHYYETRAVRPVVAPVMLAHALGIKTILLTNAAGGINRSFAPGDLMVIRQLINFSFLNVLGELGMTLPAKSDESIVDSKLSELIRCTATVHSIPMQQGSYCYLKGPSYETAAEIRMFAALHADAVGMSTYPEAITAYALGMRVGGVSLITNLATGVGTAKLSHAEVTETANSVRSKFSQLMKEVLLEL